MPFFDVYLTINRYARIEADSKAQAKEKFDSMNEEDLDLRELVQIELVQPNKNTKNKEGLSFREWMAAAGITISDSTASKCIEAWEKGEDPTEYR